MSVFTLQTRAKWACAYSGLVWGLFWLPLRWLEEAGVQGPWAAIVFYGMQCALLLPIIAWRPSGLLKGGSQLALTGLCAGGALALYGLAIVYTDAVRALLLFYLTPVWSTLLARAVLKQQITPVRWMAIALAFAGLWIILGNEVGLPWPGNLGDWLGLFSGILWAAAAVRLRTDPGNNALDITFYFSFYAFLICLVGTLLPALIFPASFMPASIAVSAPEPDAITATFYWLLPALALGAIPGTLSAMWGAKHVDPGLVALLFMTEVIVGTITIALWAGEPFGLKEITGVILIALAAILESLFALFTRRPGTNPA